MFWSMAFDWAQTTPTNPTAASVTTNIQNCQAGLTELKASGTPDTMAWNNQDSNDYSATKWLGNKSPFTPAPPYSTNATVPSPLSLSNSTKANCSSASPSARGCYFYYRLKNQSTKKYCTDDNGKPIYFIMHVKG